MPRYIISDGSQTQVPHPYGRVTNRIITRGMGPHINRLVTQGYGGPPRFVIQAIQRGVVFGQSGTKRRLRELQPVVVWAKLIEVNGKLPTKRVQGHVVVKVDKDRNFAAVMAEHVTSRVKKVLDDLKVFVKMIK